MPLKLNVGLSRKIGLPNYSSLGASCHLELELDSALLQSDKATFQQHVRHAFSACQQAVHEQLARNVPGSSNGESTHGVIVSPCDGHTGGSPPGIRTNRPQSRMRPASENQIRAIHAIANQQQVDLSALLGERFGVCHPEELSLRDASSLIDELNARAGSLPRVAG